MLEQKQIKYQLNRVNKKVKNYHDAEDILSEALLSFYDKANKSKIDKPDNLFNKIVSFKIKDYYRDKKNNEMQSIKDYDAIDNNEGVLDILHMRSVLKEVEYEVMMMYYVYGYNYDYICNALKIKRGALARILRRIKLEMLSLC